MPDYAASHLQAGGVILIQFPVQGQVYIPCSLKKHTARRLYNIKIERAHFAGYTSIFHSMSLFAVRQTDISFLLRNRTDMELYFCCVKYYGFAGRSELRK